MPLGDFNLPKPTRGASDRPVYDELAGRGLHVPGHSTEIGSSIASDNRYDQIAFFPGETGERFTGKLGVFDFDGGVFATLYRSRSLRDFLAYCRFYISDHRPMWAEFAIGTRSGALSASVSASAHAPSHAKPGTRSSSA